MKIYYEIWDWGLNVDFKNNKISSKKKLNYNIDKCILELEKLSTIPETTFLLDESKFNFFSFKIFEFYDKQISISDLNIIINKKKQLIKEKYPDAWFFLFYNIEDIVVDWLEDDYIIWNKWKISYLLNLIYINYDTYWTFKKSLWRDFNSNKNLKIYPSSFFTINFLKKRLKKQNINLLYINNDLIKLIKIKNWKLNSNLYINLWVNFLKEIFNENWSLDSFYSCINNNNLESCFFENVSSKSFDFYCNTIIKRLSENLDLSSNTILFTNLLKSKQFLDNFSMKYTNSIWWYLLPFNSSNTLETYWYNFERDEIDILTYINSI